MTLEEKYNQQYEIGFPIFEKLFNLKKDDFVQCMKDVFEDNKSVIEILENNPRVVKTIENDIPENIKVAFYGTIEITYFGISYKPEHGQSERILKFDKFFNADSILNYT